MTQDLGLCPLTTALGGRMWIALMSTRRGDHQSVHPSVSSRVTAGPGPNPRVTENEKREGSPEEMELLLKVPPLDKKCLGLRE